MITITHVCLSAAVVLSDLPPTSCSVSLPSCVFVCVFLFPGTSGRISVKGLSKDYLPSELRLRVSEHESYSAVQLFKHFSKRVRRDWLEIIKLLSETFLFISSTRLLAAPCLLQAGFLISWIIRRHRSEWNRLRCSSAVTTFLVRIVQRETIIFRLKVPFFPFVLSIRVFVDPEKVFKRL